MLNHKKHNLKGQVLLFSLLLLSAAVIIAFSLSTIFIRDIRLSNDSVASLKAFYLADWASEGNLYNYIKNGEDSSKNCVTPYVPNGDENECLGICDTKTCCKTIQCNSTGIITVGQSGSTSRSIEVNFE